MAEYTKALAICFSDIIMDTIRVGYLLKNFLKDNTMIIVKVMFRNVQKSGWNSISKCPIDVVISYL